MHDHDRKEGTACKKKRGAPSSAMIMMTMVVPGAYNRNYCTQHHTYKLSSLLLLLFYSLYNNIRNNKRAHCVVVFWWCKEMFQRYPMIYIHLYCIVCLTTLLYVFLIAIRFQSRRRVREEEKKRIMTIVTITTFFSSIFHHHQTAKLDHHHPSASF